MRDMDRLCKDCADGESCLEICHNCIEDDSKPDWRPRKNTTINGVAEEEMTTNNNGGRQSKLEYRFDLIDTKAIFALAHVLHTGKVRYGKDNWRKIDTESHLNHAISHIYAFLAGDKQDDHLAHALTRLVMSIGVEGEEK